MRSLLAIGLALGAIALVACGGEDDAATEAEDSAETTQTEELVDVKPIEDQLKETLSVPGGPPSPSPVPGQPAVPATPAVKVKSVKCPAGIEQKKDDEFKCEVQAADAKGDVDVTQEDNRGKVFKYKAKVEQPEVTITTEGKLELDAP